VSKPPIVIKYLVAAASLSAGIGSQTAVAAHEFDIAERLEDFVDVPARAVWLQQLAGGDDPHVWLNRHSLQTIETGSGGISRELLRPEFHVHRPIITPRGERVVFSSYDTRSCHVVKWDGTGLRKLGDGYALDVWSDPATGEEWVYATTTGTKDREQNKGSPVFRFPLERPDAREVVWNRTQISVHNFMLSADGELACAQFPHPRGGFARLAKKESKIVARGCWTSMAPDNSYLMWVFDGPHRNLLMHSIRDERRWAVNINSAPGMEGFEVYHPRWSNHPRFLAITGPYKEGRRGGNLIGAGGGAVEVYVGRFDQNFEEVEAWCRLTNNETGDFYPDLWVEGGEQAQGYIPVSELAANSPRASWPPSKRNAVFVWESAARHHDLPHETESGNRNCIVVPSGNAVFDRFHSMQVGNGYFDAGNFDAASMVPSHDWTFEVTFTPSLGDLGTRVGCIASFCRGNGTSMALVQRETGIFLQPQVLPAGSPAPELPIFSDAISGRTYHLIVVMGHGQLRTFLDGVPGKPISLAVPIVSSLPPHLRFGDGPRGDAPWPGTVEAVGLYGEPMSEGRALRHAASSMTRAKGRAPLPSYRVTTRLLHPIVPPGPDEIGVYRRAMVVGEYAVESKDVLNEEQILVAEWAVLDANRVLPALEKGVRREFHLEAFDEHPELEGEREFLQSDSDSFDLPKYYRLGPPESTGPANSSNVVQ